MLKEYKIGDKVLLRKGSDFYDLAPGKIGVIVELRYHERGFNDPEEYYYQVDFGVNNSNCYRYIDIISAIDDEKVKLVNHYEIGDRVAVINESHGWGEVEKGDIGTVTQIISHSLLASFPNQSDWEGTFDCFVKVNAMKENEKIQEVESISIKLNKSKKVNRLSIN
jgi:hypothetical protein